MRDDAPITVLLRLNKGQSNEPIANNSNKFQRDQGQKYSDLIGIGFDMLIFKLHKYSLKIN